MLTASVSARPSPRAADWLALVGWLALCHVAGGIGALIGAPDDWYARLDKPPGQPPSWVFAPVWTALYTMMAVSAWLVWRRGGWRDGRAPLIAFLVQLVLNALWSPLFFGLHAPGAALVCIIAMIIAISVCIVAMWPRHRLAALLMLPYLAWVLFATWLNAGIWWLNR